MVSNEDRSASFELFDAPTGLDEWISREALGPRTPAGVDQCLALPLIESGICDAELGDEVPDRLTASIRSQV